MAKIPQKFMGMLGKFADQGAVRSPQLGEVRLDLEGVKDSLGYGIGREKSAAFAAVPDIIRKGTVFDRQSRWKWAGILKTC